MGSSTAGLGCPWACSSWAKRRDWRGSEVRLVLAAATAVLRSDCIVRLLAVVDVARVRDDAELEIRLVMRP
jgi:hypothetical protein